MMIDAYRLLSETVDYPLHLGVTEAGPLPGGLVKSTAGIATLLAEGIGDTIRFSLTADPVEEAKAGPSAARGARAARAQGPRPHRVPVVRPRRGRRDQGRHATRRTRSSDRNIPLQVAVMGCVVNGPGEARDADLGIAAGRGKGHLFVRGQVVRVVPEAEMVDALVAEAEAIVAEGIEARLAAADENAEADRGGDARGAAADPGPRRQPQRREDRHDPRDRRVVPTHEAPRARAYRSSTTYHRRSGPAIMKRRVSILAAIAGVLVLAPSLAAAVGTPTRGTGRCA